MGNNQFTVVGHRGYPEKFPENTEEGLLAAVAAGVEAVELDVQCTQDGELILLHDEDFSRVAGVNRHAHSVSFDEACAISVGEKSRFGEKYSSVTVPSLHQVSRALSGGPEFVFVEIKSEAIGYLGFDSAMQKLLEATVDIKAQRIFISYHYEFLSFLKQQTGERIGWVMTYYDEASIRLAETLLPNYLICNKRKLPPEGMLPNSGWAWFVYDVKELPEAQALCKRGVQFMESWNPVGLLGTVAA